MFTLSDNGTPIARSASKRPFVLSVVDPDHSKPTKKVVKRKKRCCRDCDEEYCLDDPCCDNCPVYYQSDSESEDSSYDEPRGGKNKLIGKEFHTQHGEKLIPLPNLKERFVDYVAGPSGSGKSTMASSLATEFKKIYPKKPIYIFSRTSVDNDPAYKKLKPIQISLDETIVEDPINIEKEITEGGALMIFDDCTTIRDEAIKKEVQKLMEDAMEVGRKINCNMIILNHLVIPNEKKFARTVMNELQNLTIFPKSGSSQQIRYALKTYFGLNNKQIDTILSLNSRWVRISKSYPMYVLHENGSYIL